MKVCWDCGQETGITSIQKILGYFKWTTWYRYHEQTLMPRQTFPNGWKLYISGKNYYLRNTNNEVAHIPQYVVDTLEGKEQVTYIIGPFVFVNGFEETTEGKYLRKIFPYYFNMTPRAEEKVNKVMERYGWWVRLHNEYITEMMRRKTK